MAMKKIPKTLEGIKLPQKMWKELEHYNKTRIPRCINCHKDMVNALDSKTKKISKYLWKPVCGCSKKGYVLMVG